MIYIGKQGEAAWGDYPPQTEQMNYTLSGNLQNFQ